MKYKIGNQCELSTAQNMKNISNLAVHSKISAQQHTQLNIV